MLTLAYPSLTVIKVLLHGRVEITKQMQDGPRAGPCGGPSRLGMYQSKRQHHCYRSPVHQAAVRKLQTVANRPTTTCVMSPQRCTAVSTAPPCTRSFPPGTSLPLSWASNRSTELSTVWLYFSSSVYIGMLSPVIESMRSSPTACDTSSQRCVMLRPPHEAQLQA